MKYRPAPSRTFDLTEELRKREENDRLKRLEEKFDRILSRLEAPVISEVDLTELEMGSLH